MIEEMRIGDNKPVVVSDMKPEAHRRYAEDKALLEKAPSLLKDSSYIGQKTVVSVAKPLILSEFLHHYSMELTSRWAFFDVPDYLLTNLFSFAFAPSFGDMQSVTDKLESLGENLHKKYEGKEWDKVEKERQTLLEMCKCYNKFERILETIRGRCNQYQKG